jgi:hypothetical protein
VADPLVPDAVVPPPAVLPDVPVSPPCTQPVSVTDCDPPDLLDWLDWPFVFDPPDPCDPLDCEPVDWAAATPTANTAAMRVFSAIFRLIVLSSR